MPKLTSELSLAIESLQKGKLVAFPTETVFGLGGDATNQEAIKRIYKVKGRPSNRPLILHVPNLETVKKIVLDWSLNESKLAKKFWPGPLTLILKNGNLISQSAVAGKKTVAIRIPSHPFALSMLRSFSEIGSGIVAAPSANRFGYVSTTNARDVEFSLQNYLDETDVIVNSSPRNNCQFGLESTIVDCTTNSPKILRVGVIKKSEIESCIGKTVDVGLTEDGKIDYPGTCSSHYSPKTKFKVMTRAQIELNLSKLCEGGKTFLWYFQKPVKTSQNLTAEVAPSTAPEYGRQLYSKLNNLDRRGLNLIIFEEPPTGEDWNAICDRLEKAKSR